jgi:asparagine synthase (glutamine-hydrolysing)
LSLSSTQSLLKTQLRQITSKYLDSSLLLSGGLDSSILCYLMRPRLSIVTSLGRDSQDLKYAKDVAKKYSDNHVECVVDFDDIIKVVPKIIKTFKTFDPLEIRNSSVIFFGIKEARHSGYRSIVTGDGADELFAGYNYLQRYFGDLKKLQMILDNLWKIMRFSSIRIGKELEVKVNTPYLEKPLYDLAISMDIIEKVGHHEDKKWGKFVLRKAFAKELGTIVWRTKMALEQGSGFEQISNKFYRLIDDEEFAKESKIVAHEKVKVRDKEHLYYYRIYKSLFGPPINEICNSPRCSFCNAPLTYARYCYTCGAFPPR